MSISCLLVAFSVELPVTLLDELLVTLPVELPVELPVTLPVVLHAKRGPWFLSPFGTPSQLSVDCKSVHLDLD